MGRHRAPALVEQDRSGQPLAKPYPLARRWVRLALLLAAVAALFTVPEARSAPAVLGLVAAIGLLPRLLVPTPYPAFVTVGVQQAYALEPHCWLRLPGGWAVQALNVHIRVPDVTGDPTPPLVVLRCSDDRTRTYRPQDLVTVVQPADLRAGPRVSRRSAR